MYYINGRIFGLKTYAAVCIDPFATKPHRSIGFNPSLF
jgi:hypothetical protein